MTPSALSLTLALFIITPAPADTQFRINDKTYAVVGSVKRPYDPLIPRKVQTEHRDLGWVWQRDFMGLYLNICRDDAGNHFFIEPLSVWLNQK